MSSKTHLLPIFLISLMVSSILFNVSSFSSPGNTPRVYIDPSSIFAPRLRPGDTFTVDVKIDDVTELYAFEFRLKYDPEILKAVSIQTSFLNGPTWVGTKSMNNEQGIVWVGITSWYPAAPKTGSGTLATITFEVKDKGESVLDLYRTKLIDYDIKRISHDVEDGYFSNKQKPKLPKPPKVTLSGFSTLMASVEAADCTDIDCDLYGVGEDISGCPNPDVEDCDDAEPMMNPGTAEICDMKDNDCDGLIDEPDICCSGDVDHYIDPEGNYYEVDIADLAKLGRAFGSMEGQPRWDPYCDIYGPGGTPDGIINVFDLAKVGKNYGNTCLAGCVNINVEFVAGPPLPFANVSIVDPPQFFGTTNSTGNVTRCGVLSQGSYSVEVTYNGDLFGSGNYDGSGSVIIKGNCVNLTIHVQYSDGNPIDFEAFVRIWRTDSGSTPLDEGPTDSSGNYKTCSRAQSTCECLEDTEYELYEYFVDVHRSDDWSFIGEQFFNVPDKPIITFVY